jgi:hypothetical protein
MYSNFRLLPVAFLAYVSILKMEALSSSET